MKRKITATLVLMFLFISTVIPAFADGAKIYIRDESKVLTDADIGKLNTMADKIHTDYNASVYCLIANISQDEDLVEYAHGLYGTPESNDNNIVLALSDSEWYVYFSGSLGELTTEEDKTLLWDAFQSSENYKDAVVSYISACEGLLKEKGFTAAPPREIPSQRLLPLLVDNAGLLSAEDAAALSAKLDEISTRQQFEVAVVTVNSTEGKTPQAYADDFYDYNGYGYGENDDGCLLLVSMEERDWYITAYGFGSTAITDAGREYMSEQFLPYLSDGDYAEAFSEFADLCDDYVRQAKTGEPYDIGNMPNPIGVGTVIIISVIFGLLAAFIPVLIMKAKLKSVHFQSTADNYIRDNSLNITTSHDTFLYSNVARTERPTQNSSGGSSGHTSSSGRTHTGGGGKF